MRIRIKLLADWDLFKAGTILAMEEAEANDLIAKEIAVKYDAEAERKEAQARVDAERKEAQARVDAERADAERIQKLVDAEIAKREVESRKIASAPIELHERIEDDPRHGFKRAGEFFNSVKEAGKPGNIPDTRLFIESKSASGMNIAVGSEGGFLVPEAFSAELMKNTYEVAQASSRARQIPMTTETLTIPAIAESSRADGSRQGGVRAYWKGEGEQYTGSKPELGEVKLSLSKLTCWTSFTDELAKFSAIAIEAFLMPLFAEELAFKLDDGLINGNGAGQPLGILNAPALVVVPKENAQLAKTIVTENILKMWARLPARNRANAVWFINQDAEPQLYSMNIALGTAGVVTYMPAGGISGQPYSTLMGRPVVECEQCATLGTVGDIILADMGSYLLGQAADGVQGATSIHVRFDYGETAMRWTMFADGQPWQKSAVTPYKGSDAQSPFIALATRA